MQVPVIRALILDLTRDRMPGLIQDLTTAVQVVAAVRSRREVVAAGAAQAGVAQVVRTTEAARKGVLAGPEARSKLGGLARPLVPEAPAVLLAKLRQRLDRAGTLILVAWAEKARVVSGVRAADRRRMQVLPNRNLCCSSWSDLKVCHLKL